MWVGPDEGAGSGACDRKAEEGVDAARRRLTTTRRACVPEPASPARPDPHDTPYACWLLTETVSPVM